jgi:hypothetical protein
MLPDAKQTHLLGEGEIAPNRCLHTFDNLAPSHRSTGKREVNKAYLATPRGVSQSTSFYRAPKLSIEKNRKLCENIGLER